MRPSALRRPAVALGALVLAGAVSLAGQTPPPPDTSDMTARFLEAAEQARRVAMPLARPGGHDLLPPLGRMVFTRDSIEWGNVSTLGDLLQQVPGVYLLRAGWIGQAALPAFRGQGPHSVEYRLDGVPYLPIGADSTAVDPSVLPLSFYDRVEVERLPGLLRVHLFTRRHDRLAPRTRVAITTGDLDIGRYQGALESRLASGFGYSAAFDFLGVASLARPNENDYQNTNAWLQLSWAPTARRGASLQYFLAGPRRLSIIGGSDTLARGLDESRRDLQARVYFRERTDGLGGSLDLLATRTMWSMPATADTLPDPERQLTQVGVLAGYRVPAASVGAAAFRRSDWTTLDLSVTGAAAPSDLVSAGVEFGLRRHSLERSSRWVTARAGLQLPLGVSLNGTLREGRRVEFPMLEADSARDVSERSLTVGFESTPLGVEVGYARTAAAAPAGYWSFPGAGLVGHEGVAEWLTARVRLTPRNWFTLDAWYSDPLGEAPVGGQPPSHSRVSAAIRSQFLRVFPSGFFELKVAMSVESFGSGTLGRVEEGDPVVLRGATFARAQLHLQFGDFTAYLDRQNLLDSRAGWVPGIPSLRGANAFGIRWVFWN